MTEQEDDATELDLVYEDLRRAKARIEALEAALRECVEVFSLDEEPPYERVLSAIETGRAAIAEGQDK